MILLKSFFAENYASFADKVEFTCESVTNNKDHSRNTCVSGDLELNLVSYVYGANGSGKTYFCKILQEIKNIISNSLNNSNIFSFTQSLNSSLYSPKGFAFDTIYSDKPSTFGIELVIDNIIYHYEFSILNGLICHELLQKKRRRTETILQRTSPNNNSIELKSELKEFEPLRHVVGENSLCLTLAAYLNNSLARSIVDSIGKIQLFNMTVPHLQPANLELFSSDRLKQYEEIMKHADPTIDNLKITFSEKKISKTKKEKDFENRDLIETYINVDVKTEHSLYKDGKKTNQKIRNIDFFTEESLGTVKLFTTLPYLSNILFNGGILVLDEIENGLHIKLVKELISLFLNENKNPNHAQLICTSHQPLLIEDAKRDQVWVIYKNEKGKSYMDRLSNYPNLRNTSNLVNKVLIEGALGFNPDNYFDTYSPTQFDSISAQEKS